MTFDPLAHADAGGTQTQTWLDAEGARWLEQNMQLLDAKRLLGLRGIWRSGSGAPADAVGADGDFYLDTATTNIYERASSVYTLVGTLTSWRTVTKGSDESVISSTTVQNDNELFFTAVNNAVYEVELLLVYANAASATPDLKLDLGEDAVARGTFLSVGVDAGDVAASSVFVADQAATLVLGATTGNRAAKIVGGYVGAGGTFRLRWAQDVSGVSATIVRAGSTLRYRRIV